MHKLILMDFGSWASEFIFASVSLHIKVKGNLSCCVCKCIFLDIVFYQGSWVYCFVMMVDDTLGLLVDILFNSHVLGLLNLDYGIHFGFQC